MRMNQLTLAVHDFDQAVAFYRAWGLRLIVSSEQRYARFENPADLTTLSVHVANTATAPTTIVYFEVNDVQQQVAKLAAKGINAVLGPATRPWRWIEARYEDPSGNVLCIYSAGKDRRFPPWRLKTKD